MYAKLRHARKLNCGMHCEACGNPTARPPLCPFICRRMGVEDVVIAGVQTPNCIRGTAWDAIALDYPRVTVLADATASASDQVQQANLYDMRQVCVATPTVAEWAAQLGAEAA